MSDLKFAFRQLLKSPGFTVVALLTLALGIGVNTSMFTVLNTMLLQPLPYAQPAELVRVFRTAPQSQRWPHAPGNFNDYRAQAKSFAQLAAFAWSSCNYAEPGQPAERLRGMDVTADFFPMLGVNPTLGRFFSAEENRPGANPVIILSHATWTRRFGADPGLVGRQVRIDGALATVVGVMPPEFSPPLFWGQVELWRPLAFSADEAQRRDHNYLSALGRLAPGVSLAQAQAELNGIVARLERDFPQTNTGYGINLMDLALSGQDDSSRYMSWFVMGLAGFVLLIACANLANLQFARTAGRAREYAIRVALGAPRWRVMRELLVESLLLSLAGGALGLLIATWGNEFLARRIALATRAPGFSLELDWRVFGFALGAAVLSALACGLLPAWFAARADVNDTLKQQARGSTGDHAHHRLRHGLIVAEVALALILLAGAGVFLRGMQRFTQRDAGWQPAGLLAGYVNLPASRYPDHAAREAFYRKLRDQLAANPAFEAAALASSLPIWGYSASTNLIPEGRPAPALGQEPLMNLVDVSPDYFATVGLALRSGRGFTADDRADKPRVVIINEAMAQALWPGENPVGRRIGSADPTENDWREIVGVVSNARFPGALNPPDTAFQLYQPVSQDTFPSSAILVRGRGTPDAIGRELRRTVAAIDPDQPVHGINPVLAEIDRSLGNFTLIGQLLGGFAALGLSLAALGIYGVLSGFVAQRRTEIGLRMALGAQVGDVLRLVLGRGLWLAAAGAGLGLFGAFALTRVLHRILPELGAPDVLTITGIIAILFSVAFLACWLPARRAAKVDPMIALRAE